MVLTPTPSNAPSIWIPAAVFCVFSSLAVAVRFWSRLQLNTFVGPDDWVILVSLIFALACNGDLIVACIYGYGKHGSDLTVYNRKMALELFYLSQMFYNGSINSTKVSIILLYHRLFAQKPFRKACRVILGFVIACSIATTMSSIFQCTPVKRAWDRSLPGTCIKITAFWYVNAGFSVTGDLIILVLPMPTICGLLLGMNQKLSLIGLFALGGFVIVTSVLRMTTLDTMLKSPDPTFTVTATTWTILEMNIAILCACLPMCRIPLARLFPFVFRSAALSPTSNHQAGYPNILGPFVHAGTANNDWDPQASHAERRLESRQSVSVVGGVQGGRGGSDERDSWFEYVLQHIKGVESEGVVIGPVLVGARIQKTTEFSVKYGNERV